ncbi:hypothetical protein [Synechococcus sp. CS-1332]|uniref:hypothetical protein n=1 Tax=Synechococcus sp. CS-1332 TaxID=2847972 RepID=UPI00223A8908|nr:hypothetical protein [Synechococcus sp. CS-1332]MCT0207407.1 hypothetical protein [Synechococcus sp. CS-1332]
MSAPHSAGRLPPRLGLALLVGGGLVSFVALGATPHDGLHPLALMGALLPLQLAALVWALLNRR